jgi:hypothetical protein
VKKEGRKESNIYKEKTSFNHGHQSHSNSLIQFNWWSQKKHLVNKTAERRNLDELTSKWEYGRRAIEENLCCLFLSHIALEFRIQNTLKIIYISHPKTAFKLIYRLVFSRCIIQFDSFVNAFWKEINGCVSQLVKTSKEFNKMISFYDFPLSDGLGQHPRVL